MPYELLSPQLQTLVAAAGLATACSVIDAVQARVAVPEADAAGVAERSGRSEPQRARLLLPPTR